MSLNNALSAFIVMVKSHRAKSIEAHNKVCRKAGVASTNSVCALHKRTIGKDCIRPNCLNAFWTTHKTTQEDTWINTVALVHYQKVSGSISAAVFIYWVPLL